MFHEAYEGDDPLTGLPNVERRVLRMPGHRWDLWQQVRLPVAAKLAGARVLHCPDQWGPRYPLTPMLVTIHDVVPLEIAPEEPWAQTWGKRVAASARKARHIITPSEYTKRQVVERFGVPPERITVNYWAPDGTCEKVSDPAELDRVRVKYHIEPGRPYVLGFGAADPRKNVERILRAWAGLPGPLRAEFALLLVGIQEPALTAFRKLAAELGLVDGCLLHGFADEADIPALLSGATVLAYPSLSEGFGLPVVDAFACEAAVLTSNTTSLPEVAGDATLLVDPLDVQAIRAAFEQLLPDGALRAELVARGRERLKRFTWESCADCVVRILETVAQGCPAVQPRRPRARTAASLHR
jgi:glycosyltransferase involved in cell wall biosynthesis